MILKDSYLLEDIKKVLHILRIIYKEHISTAVTITHTLGLLIGGIKLGLNGHVIV